jgi:Tol biopolymer transport system component
MQNDLVQLYRLIQAGQKQTAFNQLREWVHHSPNDERIWFLLSLAVDQPNEQVYCLERVLRLDPHNRIAQERLQALQQALAAEKPPTSQTQPNLAVRPVHLPYTGTQKPVAREVAPTTPTSTPRPARQVGTAEGSTQPLPPKPSIANKPAIVAIPIPHPPKTLVPVAESTVPQPATLRQRREENKQEKLYKGFRRQIWLAGLLIFILLLLGAGYLWQSGQLSAWFPIPEPTQLSELPDPTLPTPVVTETVSPTFTPSPLPSQTPTITLTPLPLSSLTAVAGLASSTPATAVVGNPSVVPMTAVPANMAEAIVPNGWLAFVQVEGTRQQIFAFAAPEQHPKNVIQPTYLMPLQPGERVSAPVWSPDGKRIAWSAVVDGQADVFVANADGSVPVNLTQHAANDSQPTWSPDGTQLAFISDRAGFPHVFTMSANGEDVEQRTKGEFSADSPNWSPKGIEILFAGNKNNGYWDIYAVSHNGSNLRTITQDEWDDRSPVFSPDAQQIAFISNRAGNPDVFLMDIEGNNLFNLSESSGNEQTPCWSPDGLWVVYSSTRDASLSADLYMQGRADAILVRLTNNDNAAELSPSWQLTQ